MSILKDTIKYPECLTYVYYYLDNATYTKEYFEIIKKHLEDHPNIQIKIIIPDKGVLFWIDCMIQLEHIWYGDIKKIMDDTTKLTKERILNLGFEYTRTWDVTKYMPEGSATEYRLENINGYAMLVCHHSKELEGEEGQIITIPERWSVDIYSYTDKNDTFKTRDIQNIERLKSILKLFNIEKQ